MSRRRRNPAGNRSTQSHWEVDFYKILGVAMGVGPEELKAAYRATIRRVHPDLHPHADSTEAAQRVNEAYEVLSNPRRRAAYHRARAALKRSRAKPRVAKRAAPPRPKVPPHPSAERSDTQARPITRDPVFSHLVVGAAAGILEGLLFGTRQRKR